MKTNYLLRLCIPVILLYSFMVMPYLNAAPKIPKPWDNGLLKISQDGRFMQFANGKPFFWLGDTGWLLPERLQRDEAAYYLKRCGDAGYNVVQIQVVNDVPAYNIYGKLSMPKGFDFSTIDTEEGYGYCQHMDFIIDQAAANGIYVGMVCIWGGLVKAGLMNEAQAKAYGTFLANRYKNRPNIIWIMGGDIQGNIRTEVWDALARTIKSIDKRHLMTFHPCGRTTSARWFNNREWRVGH